MSFKGERINQNLPTVAIVGATSGSFTINPNITTSGNSGTVGVVAVDENRVVKHNHIHTSSGLDQYPVITGDATITITAPTTDIDGNSVTTQVHYTLNGRNPTSKAVKKSNVLNDAGIQSRVNRSSSGAARVYESALVIENSRPGSDLCTLRIRVYKQANQEISGNTVSGISPNEKSKVLIVRFVLNNASFTLPTAR